MDIRSLSSMFEPELIKVGTALFKEGLVSIPSTFWSEQFKVRASQDYIVELDIEPEKNRISWYCNCGESDAGRNCEHVWAAILKASEDGRFGVVLEKFENQTSGVSDRTSLKTSNSLLTKENIYVLDLERSVQHEQCYFDILVRRKFRDGTTTNFFHEEISLREIKNYKSAVDKDIIRLLYKDQWFASNASHRFDAFWLAPERGPEIIEEISRAKKLFVKLPNKKIEPLNFESTTHKNNLKLKIEIVRKNKDYETRSSIGNDNTDFKSNSEVNTIGSYAIVGNHMFISELPYYTALYSEFKKNPTQIVKAHEIPILLSAIYKSEFVPDVVAPPEFKYANKLEFNKVRLVVDRVKDRNALSVHIEPKYGEEYINPLKEGSFHILDHYNKIIYKRDIDAEEKLEDKLYDLLGRVHASPGAEGRLLIKEKQLLGLIEKAFELKWEVVAYNRKVSRAGEPKVRVSSGIDWFDLSADLKFSNGQILTLPDLLKGVRSGRLVTLADGSYGILNEDLVKKFSALGLGAKIVKNKVRLSKIQAMYCAEVFKEDPRFQADKKFKTISKLSKVSSSPPSASPDGKFKGRLWPYQKKGLGWMEALTKQDIGCLLADDMGLGKTICILALLSKKLKGQALIVVPKSLVTNWCLEAEKFTPHLNVHSHYSGGRHLEKSNFKNADIIITTYHTLKNDIENFRKHNFEFLIIDEAQNVKNLDTDIHKTVKLIQATKKIALTGTPIENSTGDLFSIMNIVTPGLVSNSAFLKHANADDPAVLNQISSALRPFFLRRRKETVLKDLPRKTEQTLYCELTPEERREYDHLSKHYRAQLKGLMNKNELGKSRMNVLAWLQDLRQAACHQGILKPSKANKPSAKFELLLENLETILAEDNKCLIFSNFLEPLRLLKRQLDKRRIKYEYMDGKTNKRQDIVNRFQNNPDVKVLLMTLKTGGVGLNLTAANYVFILDPWWNPAAESQAIDRAHRIGQKNKITAYKLISKNTVEEKMQALQAKKKSIAQAILEGGKGLKKLTFEDLESLFL